MLGKFTTFSKNFFYSTVSYFTASVGHGMMRSLLWTCTWDVDGLEDFKKLASSEKCILTLWHNRLALVPFILYRFAPQFNYTAVISNSRDGKLLRKVVESYPNGQTIPVAHDKRHQALKEVIHSLEKENKIIVITPDGPRGPLYKVKAGTALAAIQTEAYIIPLTWTADQYWEFNTWDRLRVPRPFSKIKVNFGGHARFYKEGETTVEQAQEILQRTMDYFNEEPSQE